MAQERDRISEEVEEALRRAGAHELRPSAASSGGALRRLSFDPRPSSPSQLMIAGGLLILAQWLRLYALVGLGRLGPTLATIGLVLLLVGLLTWLIRPPRREMYWRGRRIELEPSPAWQHRLYSLLYRQS